jgi:hypothetical protein
LELILAGKSEEMVERMVMLGASVTIDNNAGEITTQMAESKARKWGCVISSVHEREHHVPGVCQQIHWALAEHD